MYPKKNYNTLKKNKQFEIYTIELPFFCITWRNLITTLEEGRMITWRFPRFSALEMVFKQSARTDIFVI